MLSCYATVIAHPATSHQLCWSD